MERLDAFMARSNALYYGSHDPFRDFTTAPEISQVFGELLGAWAAIAWAAMGRPRPVILAELGPGRGTLMRDALRTIRAVAPDFAASLSLHLVETSRRLREIQADRLAATWHDSLDTLPRAPLILLANEFLDALPIRQFVRRGSSWVERWVSDGRWVEAEPDGLAPTRPIGGEGHVTEIGEAAKSVIGAVATRLVDHAGAALFLDYGADTGGGDTLQAIRNARPANPLVDPGKADLTAHVDFAALAATATQHGATVHGPIPQGMFLARLGLHQRSLRLAEGLSPARAAAILAAAQRLAEPAHMGRLFKAVALTGPASPIPAGFEECR